MADNSKIEWTDATWNPITGCSVLSPGCKHCYAMLLAGTRLSGHPSRAGLTVDTKAGPVWTGEVRFNEQWLDQPLRWRRPRTIFVCAHADLFHDAVPDEWIDRIFAVMAAAPRHRFQVLTKRSERMRDYLAELAKLGTRRTKIYAGGCRMMKETDPRRRDVPPRFPLSNVWLGVSVEDAARLDRIEALRETPAAVRWISAEPLLGSLKGIDLTGIDWVVSGGESGPNARPSHPDWHRELRDACASSRVAYHFKQWGEWVSAEQVGEDHPAMLRLQSEVIHRDRIDLVCDLKGLQLGRVGKKAAGRLLDGVQHDGMPA